MARYGKIKSGFWHNGRVRKLSERAKMLLLYLYSCPHGNSIGAFVLHDGYIASDLGWAFETVSQTLSELFEKGFLERDEATFLVRILGWWEHNAIENPNVAKNVAKEIASLPNCETKQSVIDELLALETVHVTVRETLSRLLPKPFRNPNLTKPNLTVQEKMPLADASAPSEEADLFRRGKEVLGKGAGGLITKLVKAKDGSHALARAAIEQASTKENPREYIGRIVKGAGPPPPVEEIDWDARVREYRETNNDRWWIKLGPEPGYGGCKAPREILEKYGYASREPSAA